jgi:hypothetical protein
MSLGRKLSYIRAEGDAAIQAGDADRMMNLMAANFRPMMNALDKLDDLLRNFDGQHWAQDIMHDVTEDFGEEPPPDIAASRK